MSPMNPWLTGLNPEQQAAVSHTDGPLLILAGAGSGKTTVLVARTGRLIDQEGILPERICVLTFTNKAANELKSRVTKRVGKAAHKVWAGTFHGFGLQFLKENWKLAGLPKKFGVIDGSDSVAIIKDLLREHKAYEKERFSVERLMDKIGTYRKTMNDKFLDDSIESVMAIVLAPKYLKRMRQLGVVDFEELLYGPLKILKENSLIREAMQGRFDHVMVDEFQDTNHVQMKLIDMICGERRNIAVVGDDDQSIYGWRGAEVKNILDFPKRYQNCHVVRLERNYRSSETILNFANSIIASNKDRHTKILRPGLKDKGLLPEVFSFEDENAEVEGLIAELENLYKEGSQWKEMAVLYRSNSQGGLVEGALRRAQIPYKLTGGTALFDKKEAKDVLAFVRSSLHPTEVSFRRVINLPPRGLGEKTLDSIEEAHENLAFHKKAHLWAQRNSSERAAHSIFNFLNTLEKLKTQLVVSHRDAETVLCEELEQMGYRDFINQNYRDPGVAEKRWWSVQILGRILNTMFEKHGRSTNTLEKFIDSMELRDSVDDTNDKNTNAVQLMTLHACKGLEFPYVFLIGVEEDLLPHIKLGQDTAEERRLFYVGVTRAQKHLILSRARQRKRYGRLQPVSPSRFLAELDEQLYDSHEDMRPVSTEDRKAAVADFMKQLDEKIARRQAFESSET